MFRRLGIATFLTVTPRPKSRMVVIALLFWLLTGGVVASAQSVKLSRSSLNFGNQAVGTTSPAFNVILTNTDSTTPLAVSGITASGNYSESDNCAGSVAPTLSCTLLITFMPNSAGLLSGVITLNDDASNSPQLISAKGTGVVPLTVAPSSLAFGTVAVGGTSPAQTVTLTNNLTSNVTFSFTTSGDYAATGSGANPCGSSLAGHASCTLSVTFGPKNNGSINGVLTVTQTVNSTPQIVALSGSGTGGKAGPLGFSPANLSFPSTAAGTTSAGKTVIVTNKSTKTVTISSFPASTDYAATPGNASPCGGPLIAGNQCTITVTFDPIQSGTIKGSVTFEDDAAINPQILNLTGQAIAPVSVSPASLTFAAQALGTTSAPQTVTVTNHENVTLTINAIVASGDYGTMALGTNPCGSTLAALSSCTVGVVFNPIGRTGTILGDLTIRSNASSSPQVLGISGTTRGLLPRFAYVPNPFDNTISTFTVNFSTGQLRHTGYILAGFQPSDVTVTPSGKFAYAANGSNGGSILAYNVNGKNGGLTPIAGSPFGTGTGAPTVDPSGKFLYTANIGTNNVSAFTINATTGALTEVSGSPFATDIAPTMVTIDPSGKFAYTPNVNSSPGTVSGFTINSTTGALTPIPGSPFATVIDPNSLAVDPSGRFAYVASDTNKISAYAINSTTGALTPIAGSPFDGGGEPFSVTVDPTGQFLYAADPGFNSVSAFTINVSTGALTAVAGSPFAAGTGPTIVRANPTGSFLYVMNKSSNDVWTYSIKASSGALSVVERIGTRTNPFSFALSRGVTPVTYVPKFAYAANFTSNDMSAYTINASTGALTSVGPNVAAGTSPIGVTVDPSGRFAYVANDSSNNVSAYTINASTGALTSVGPNVAAGSQPYSVTVDSSGRFAYVANASSNNVSAYTINASTGALTSVGPNVAAGSDPLSVTVDPSGRFAYVTNFDSNDVSAYAINASTGALTSVGPNVAAGTNPHGVTVDPSGRFAYVANDSSNNVSAYTINASTGALTSVGPNVAAGTHPVGVTVDPSGRFAYVANEMSNDVSAYTINATTGALTSVGPSVIAGTLPESVTVDPSGRFAYVANNGSNDVSAYTVNTDTGALTSVGPNAAAGSNPFSVATTGRAH